MPSQLLKNDKISFVVAKPFTSRGKTYEVGADFPQEDARDIDTFVRARFVIPVVDKLEDKPRHWHKHIRPKDEVLERLSRDRVQLRMPEGQEPDSDEVVNLGVLTHPETTPEPEEPADEPDEEEYEEPPAAEAEPEPVESLEETYDPAEHNVDAVKEYIAEHPEQEEAILALEAAGRGRKGLVGE